MAGKLGKGRFHSHQQRKYVMRMLKTMPQHGETNVAIDMKLKARKPGRRISKTGKEYTETRRNRSDKKENY